jgi:hypothetical protein
MKVLRFYLQIFLLLLLVLGFSMPARADLDLIGQGTSTHGTYNLIYDTDLNITWYDFTMYNSVMLNKNEWVEQMGWASSLSVTFGSNTYEDWRLPTADPTCFEYDCTDSEMGHLYYIEGVTPSTPGDFENLQSTYYWSGTEYSTDSIAFNFNTSDGYQFVYQKSNTFSAIAVRSGLAVSVVPEPISSTLFIIGGATLGFRRYMRRKLP